jgi:hypothetical protein
LLTAFLAVHAKRIRNAGAQMIRPGPPRPAPYVVGKPAIVVPDLDIKTASWASGQPVPMPELKPEPKDIKRVFQGVTPWFVPSRPKPPVLQARPQETPAGWKSPVTPKALPAPIATLAPPEPTGELSSLAKALNEYEPGRDLERPWPERKFTPVITPLADWWMTCSNQVRIMVIALPLLVAIAVKPLSHSSAGVPSMDERPSAPVRSAHAQNPRQGMPTPMPEVPQELEARVERATKSQFDGFKKAIVSRAAVEMADDFQAGLDNWDGNSQLGPSWSYDRTGFIRPRALGIYRPSTGLSDYAFEFLGKIDQHAISWVFRASDLNNYYAMKLVDKTGGVTPQMALVHYAVIEGREGPKKEVPLPIPVYKDTLFRIRMDIQGPHFSVQVQGTVVDYWKDNRLKSGGVGFFASRGEESRVRWVQVTHQDDMLGKLCAFLSPYAM